MLRWNTLRGRRFLLPIRSAILERAPSRLVGGRESHPNEVRFIFFIGVSFPYKVRKFTYTHPSSPPLAPRCRLPRLPGSEGEGGGQSPQCGGSTGEGRSRTGGNWGSRWVMLRITNRSGAYGKPSTLWKPTL